jgi:tripartite-type tricarboxylate transporter receptor subunit TctC
MARIRRRHQAAIDTNVETQNTRECRIRLLGAVPMPGTPEEFGRFIRSEHEKWAKVVAETGPKGR